MLYFAYGSNMKHKQMKERCPSSKYLGSAYAANWKFVYDGKSIKWNGPVANIIKSEGDVVWGGIFRINKDNLAALDCYEGYPKSYNRGDIDVKDMKGRKHKVVAYYRTGENVEKPSEGYRKTVLKGAKDCCLPKKYIKDTL